MDKLNALFEQVPKPVVGLLALLGARFVFWKVFSFVELLFSLFVLPGTSLRKFGPKGSWAVVTGASDGLGKEFALQISSQGYNVALVSRTAAKLDELAAEIRSKNKVEARTLAMDFAANDDADYEKLADLVSDLDVSILVNNVGKSHRMPVPFLQTKLDDMTDIIAINCVATLRVTQIVAPRLVSRKRGLILTMASFGGVMPTPLLATYSGSKAFLQQWSSALGSELAPHGVTVHLVQASMIASAMSRIRRPSIMVPTPKAFVREALGKIGRSGGSQGVAFTGTPWWSHAIQLWAIVNLTPGGPMSRLVIERNGAMLGNIRERALRKAAREGRKVD